MQNNNPAAEEYTFAHHGYFGCFVATASVAAAMFLTLRLPPLSTGQDSEIIDAALVSLAAILCAVCMTFEIYIARMTRSPLISLTAGMVALPAFVLILKFHGALPWAAIATVLIRQITVAQKISLRSIVSVGLSGAMIGYWGFLLTYVDGYKTPWINEAIGAGTVHVDMLFHAAIVNMLAGFDAPSMGVDGIVPFPYHFGSHRLVAFFCHLLGIGALKFYAVAFTLFFAPLFILASFFFSTSFLSFISRTETTKNTKRQPTHPEWFWIAFAVVFIGPIPIAIRRTLGVWDNVFHSESFGIAVLFSYFAGIWIFDQLGKKPPLRFRWHYYPMIAAYLIALCSLKISVGIVVGCLLAYVILRLPLTLMQRSLAWLAMATSVIYGYLSTRGSAHSTNSGPGFLQMIKPFAFIRDNLLPEYWAPSFFAFFGPMLVFFALRIFRSPPNTTGLIAVLRATPGDVEMIAVITLVSMIPGLLLAVPQGSTNFFAEISYWWVQPMLSVVLASTFATAARRAQIVSADASHDS